MADVIPLLAAFGFGSVVTALVSSWLSSKRETAERRFQEKKAAFIGLLEAYHAAAVEPSDANSKAFAYWQLRCDLVASKEVRSAIVQIIETNDNTATRMLAHETLKGSMREDLGVAK
jgi:hypothetical protein